MTFPTLDVLRLEVEVPPTGLPNLVENPSGEKGAWFWITPVTNTVMTSTGTTLAFTTTVSQAAYFTSDFMPVAASKYVAARFDLTAITASHNLKVRFEWYDAAKVLLSSSTQSGALSTLGTNYYGAVQAPASTVYVKVRFDLYNGTGNPSANATATLTKAMVTWADTGAFSTMRTNLVTNPSFEVDTSGWITTGVGAQMARSTAQAAVGTASLSVWNTITTDASNASWPTTGTYLAVTAGRDYTAQAQVRADTVPGPCSVLFAWYKSPGVQSATPFTYGQAITSSTTAWQTVSLVATAPSDATLARVTFNCHPNPGTAKHYLDAVMLEQASTVGTAFDGSTADAGGVTYDWTGTAHASTSTATTANYAFTEPLAWQNILGPTHEIKISREALNVGTLSATVLDALLDPAVADTIRPGRQVRVTVLSSGTWASLYEGTLTNAHVTYDLNVEDARQARITLTASDNIRQLTNASRAQGVPNISDLPYVLEGAGVPWNVNGSGNQVSTATTVSVNDSASALDQVAITRDSVLGYAWVDRNNVLSAYDAAQMPTTWVLTATNLVTNPSFETDVTGWIAYIGVNAPTRVTTTPYVGIARLSAVGSSTSTVPRVRYRLDGLSPGDVLSLQARVRSDGQTPTHSWFGVKSHLNGAEVGTLAGVTTAWAPDANGWMLVSGTVTIPASGVNGVFFTPGVQTAATYTGTLGVDAVMVEKRATVGTYFDGDTADTTGTTYAWTGTPNASTSTRSDLVTIDEDDYSDLDVSFDTDTCINEVLVKFLRWDGAQTQEVIYGPYRDQASIDEWGPHSADFTIHAVSESASAIQAYASGILAANGTPEVRINQVTVPVRTAADLTTAKALLDLYALVHLVNAEKGIDDLSRVTGIGHTISPDGWLMNLDFTADGSVASPQVTPDITNGATPVGGPVPVGGLSMWSTATAPAGWLLCDGQSVPVASYPNLHAVIGYTFGGSGANFNVPNFGDRIPIGAGTKAVGTSGGAATKQIATANLPDHYHNIGQAGSDPNTEHKQDAASGGFVPTHATYASHNHGGQTGVAPGGSSSNGTALDVMNPWRAIYFIIRT